MNYLSAGSTLDIKGKNVPNFEMIMKEFKFIVKAC